MKSAFCFFLIAATLAYPQTQPLIGIKGANPPRLKWEEIKKAFDQFKATYIKTLNAWDEATHDSFHGKFKEYFPRLPENIRNHLVRTYAPIFGEDKISIRDRLTYNGVFKLGDQPEDLLFPLFLTDDCVQLNELDGLMLRGKDGKEKGLLVDVSSDRYGGIRARFKNLKGETKEWIEGMDGNNVRWSDVKNKSLIVTFLLR
jgi:hypothetical protein